MKAVMISPMGSGDPKQERQRLADNYASMTDGELQQLARSAHALTDVAWEALEDEMDRRNLKVPEDATPTRLPRMELRELVTIRKFRDLPEALLAKGCLESVGIECFLGDENLVRLDWFISNFIGGIKLNVRPADAENARKLLDEPILEGLYVQGVGLYEQPRCPQCQSLDVNFQALEAWHCQSCDAEWEEDATAES